jgi:predicted nucleotidyltransferase
MKAGYCMTESISSPSVSLSGEFLSRLVAELDESTVTAIILHGSYARGDAVPPYSDIDLVRILYETPERKQLKRFIWYGGYLLNLSSRPLSVYKEWLTLPQEAIFRISTIRDAHILLDKDGTFRAFQQETLTWQWEPLQVAADAFASQLIVELSETILRILGALRFQKTVMLVQRILLHVLPGVTKAIVVQRGILVRGNNYLQQIQETLGIDSAWTHYYMHAAGMAPDGVPNTIEARSIAVLRLYQETVRLLHSHLLPEHRETVEVLTNMVDQILNEKIT